jgi:hypothetical protein
MGIRLREQRRAASSREAGARVGPTLSGRSWAAPRIKESTGGEPQRITIRGAKLNVKVKNIRLDVSNLSCNMDLCQLLPAFRNLTRNGVIRRSIEDAGPAAAGDSPPRGDGSS